MQRALSKKAKVMLLVHVTQKLSFARSLTEVMEIGRQAARSITDADGATFVLRDDDKCYYADEDAISPLWKGQRFPMKACISGWVMEHGEAVMIEDIYQDPRIPTEVYRPTFVKSLAMVPIRREQAIGAIGNYWATKQRLSAEQMELLQALADAISLAMENVKLYNSQERQIAELAQANRMKDEFLMVLSHELRTPLNGIIGWAQLLNSNDVEPDQLKHAYATIEKCAMAQCRLVDDLLDMSRIISGRFSIERKPVDIQSVLQMAIENHQPIAGKKSIQIDVTKIEHKTMMLLGDFERLQQAIGNIISNAIKFSPERSTIEISTLCSLDNKVSVSVKDYGTGIPHDFLPKIFERFTQADSSSTRKTGGLGLGLAIAKHIVERHQGKIEVCSKGNLQGAEFTVTLPLMN